MDAMIILWFALGAVVGYGVCYYTKVKYRK